MTTHSDFDYRFGENSGLLTQTRLAAKCGQSFCVVAGWLGPHGETSRFVALDISVQTRRVVLIIAVCADHEVNRVAGMEVEPTMKWMIARRGRQSANGQSVEQ